MDVIPGELLSLSILPQAGDVIIVACVNTLHNAIPQDIDGASQQRWAAVLNQPHPVGYSQ